MSLRPPSSRSRPAFTANGAAQAAPTKPRPRGSIRRSFSPLGASNPPQNASCEAPEQWAAGQALRLSRLSRRSTSDLRAVAPAADRVSPKTLSAVSLAGVTRRSRLLGFLRPQGGVPGNIRLAAISRQLRSLVGFRVSAGLFARPHVRRHRGNDAPAAAGSAEVRVATARRQGQPTTPSVAAPELHACHSAGV